MSSVNPHSVRNAMVTPTERQTHAREADIKCVCVSSDVYVKAKPMEPNSKRESKSNQPINTADYLPCMRAKMSREARSRFDGASAGDAEDMDGEEEDAHSRHSSVLWERHIEQSIFVDISDDDSLHFSDMQGAFTVHLSQDTGAPESPKLTDNAELSESCETEEGSSESVESVNSEHTKHSNTRDRKGNVIKAAMQKLKTAVKPIIGTHEDDAVNTSDEEHEELPYDAIEDMAPPLATPIQPANHITDFLLRHFSQEELLNSSRIIEAETLPEMSLMDSIDETVLSRASRAPQVGKGEGEKIQDVMEEPDPSTSGSHGVVEINIPDESSSSKKPGTTCIIDDDDDDKECPKQNSSANSLDLSKADAQNPKCSFSRTRSYSELKYGQGKVHYPLPDFSKVAPKVKIPKGNGSVKPVNQSPAMTRAQSSPGILGKSTSSCKATADIISRVLEDSMPPEKHNVFTDKEVAHQLQAEYDRLLAKYTEAENLIGQQIHASSEPSVSIDWNDATSNNDNTEAIVFLSPAEYCDILHLHLRPHILSICSTGPSEKQFSLHNSVPVLTESQSPTDGERLTSELRDIIRSFTQKVDEFKPCVTTMSMNVEEQQMVLKSMMEAQDQLERNYLTKREEHRALEMQNYRGLARNTGEFDPDREVEGQIFRIGMHLEDIKEQIDRNVCHVYYPPSSSFTPSPPPCENIPLSSSHPSLHEELDFSISSVRHNMEDNDDEEASEDHRADEPFPGCTENRFYLQYSTFSTETPGTANEEEEDRLTTREEDNILAQLSNSTSLKKLTYDRYEEKIRPSEASFPSVGASAGHSPQPATDKTQRFLSPETDSGFGSFDLSRPNTGLSKTPPSAVSSALSDDVISMASMSGPDSEASHSNVRTTISMAPRPVQPTVNHLEFEQLVPPGMEAKTITQNATVRVSKENAASVGGATPTHNQVTEGRKDLRLGKSHSANEMHSASHCSCHNSEVILALQYEVSRLKRALEESLGHLPHVSKRTDYLNGRCPLEKKHKGQTRGQNRAASSRRAKTDSNPQKIEDWISSDMELSKSKDGEDSDHTMSFQRAFSPPYGQIRTRFGAPAEKRSHDSKTSSRASAESFPLDTSQFSQSGSHRRVSVGPTIHSINTEPTNKSASYRPAVGNLRNIFLNSTHPAPSIPAHLSHKPLLQVNYGSSCSLPAGFKVRDQASEPVSSRRRSTQSDSALLPSNIFFQRTSPRTTGRRQHTSREESIHKTLDKALQAAFVMKQTTDRMADALSADLAKAQLQKKLQGLRPLSSRAGS
ncbi:microtubule organization protein AKNA-like [Rhinichthys klamathensis goyatoka]|uniref:microtubule organization protein AKNA-like n=1 Tax=Rhinichthys klamathensis goyatoka TaxID=3034132 RepID=UPI0024B4E49D|nr:microtubule organization protein AKNA-like [Rhinichthys klamathensis goyatoka]